MKSTGIVRKVDQLGRIVIPIELRRMLGIDIGDPLEIFLNDERITLRKYMPDIEKESIINGLSDFYSLPKDKQVDILERALNLIV